MKISQEIRGCRRSRKGMKENQKFIEQGKEIYNTKIVQRVKRIDFMN
jgi:hypothetical protein